MIVRVVKMTFALDKVEDFLHNFDKNKEAIRAFSGCNKLRLLKEVGKENVYFTYSWWDDEESLNNYRKSELFEGVWKLTKTFFADKPQAWSLENLIEL